MGNSKNPLLKDFRGHIEKTIVVKQYFDSRTMITTYPDMSRTKPCQAQKEQRFLFKDTVNYPKSILANHLEKSKAQIRLTKRNGNLYHSLFKEYIVQNLKNHSV